MGKLESPSSGRIHNDTLIDTDEFTDATSPARPVPHLAGHLDQPGSDCRTVRQLRANEEQRLQQLSQDLVGL